MHVLVFKTGFNQKHSFDAQLPAFEDSISTLFAPIIISCSTMVDRLGDNYTSFSTDNNHIYVLHQVGKLCSICTKTV